VIPADERASDLFQLGLSFELSGPKAALFEGGFLGSDTECGPA